MKTFLAYLMCLSVLLGSMGSTILWLHYELNKNYYASMLCQNKSKPMLHCNGKCALSREVKELEKKAKMPFSPIKEKQETVQYFESHDELFSPTVEEPNQNHIDYYTVQTLPEVYFSVFHPPTI